MEMIVTFVVVSYLGVLCLGLAFNLRKWNNKKKFKGLRLVKKGDKK